MEWNSDSFWKLTVFVKNFSCLQKKWVRFSFVIVYSQGWLKFDFFLLNIWIFQLPNGVTYHTGTYQDRLGKLQEHLRQLSILFRKLRLVYDKCNENCAGLEPIPIEVSEMGREAQISRPEEEGSWFVSKSHLF